MSNKKENQIEIEWEKYETENRKSNGVQEWRARKMHRLTMVMEVAVRILHDANANAATLPTRVAPRHIVGIRIGMRQPPSSIYKLCFSYVNKNNEPGSSGLLAGWQLKATACFCVGMLYGLCATLPHSRCTNALFVCAALKSISLARINIAAATEWNLMENFEPACDPHSSVC